MVGVRWAESKRQKEADALFGTERETTTPVVRQGARRPRIKIASQFEAVLTERQRTVLKGKARTAKAWGRILQIMEDTGMTMEEFVEGLSNEELARGRVKDKNGHFSGRPPQWVPRAFHRACIGELLKRGKTLWQSNYIESIEAMARIAKGGKGITPAEQIKAATFVIERLEGKVPERLIVSDDQPWQLVIDGIVADVSDESVMRAQKALNGAVAVRQELTDEEDGDAADIIEAELVEEEEEPRRSAPARRPSAATRRRRASR